MKKIYTNPLIPAATKNRQPDSLGEFFNCINATNASMKQIRNIATNNKIIDERRDTISPKKLISRIEEESVEAPTKKVIAHKDKHPTIASPSRHTPITPNTFPKYGSLVPFLPSFL